MPLREENRCSPLSQVIVAPGSLRFDVNVMVASEPCRDELVVPPLDLVEEHAMNVGRDKNSDFVLDNDGVYKVNKAMIMVKVFEAKDGFMRHDDLPLSLAATKGTI